MRPGRLRRWVLRPLLWGLAALAVLVFVLQQLLDTRWARDGARELLCEKLSAALDREVRIVDLSFELLPLSVEVWGLTVSGLEPGGAHFLEIPFAAIDADLSALQKGRIHLQEVRVQRPVVYIEYFPDGTHNLLRLRREGPAGPRRFDVYVDRLVVDRADFALDQRSVQLSIAADSVRTRLRGIGEMQLTGQLDAHNVVVRLPNARPVTVAVSGRGVVRRGEVDVESARVSGPDLTATGHGTCDYPRGAREQRKCLFQVQGRTRGELLADLGYFAELSGAVDFDGSLTWRPGLTGWRSRLAAEELQIWNRRVEDFAGSLVADRYGFRIGIDAARYAGGLVSGAVAWEPKEEGRPWILDLGFRGLRLDTLLADQEIPTAGYAARLGGHLTYRFPAQLSGYGDGTGEVDVEPDPESPGLPLAGAFPLRITGGTVRTDAISLQSERQSVLAGGWYHLGRGDGAFDYAITSADVTELVPLLLLEESGEPFLWLPDAGRGDLEGTLHLRPAAAGGASADLRLRLRDVVAPGARARRVTGAMHLTADAARSLRLALGDGDEALLVRGEMPYEPDAEGPIELAFDAVGWPLEAVRPWLDFELPVGGRISGHLDLTADDVSSYGALEGRVVPASLKPDAWATASLPWSIDEIDLDSLTTRLEWDAERIRFERLNMVAPSGVVTAAGTLGWTSQALDLELRSAALQLSEPPLRRYLPRADLRGTVSVAGRLGGWLYQPRLELVAEADGLALGSRALQGRPSRLEVAWGDGRFEIEGRLLDMVTLAGGGTLEPGRADLAIEIDGSDLSGLAELMLEAPPADLGGRFEGALSVRGEGEEPIAVDLELGELEVELGERTLASLEPVRARLDPEHLTIDSLQLAEAATGTEIRLAGRLGYAPPAALDLELDSTLSGPWLELLGPGLEIDGTLDLAGRIGGTFERPSFDGRGELARGRVVLSSEPPVVIRDLAGALTFHPGQVVLDRLEGSLGGGRVAVDGQATLPRPDRPLAYRLQLAGTDLAVRDLEGWSARGGAQLSLASNGEGHLLDGRAQLVALEYTENVGVDFERLARGFLQRQRLEVEPADSVLSTVELNVDVEAPGAVKVRNNLADFTGSARLLIRGNLARPVLYGEVEIDPEGTLRYNATDYRIERGRVVFANPYELDPEIDLVAVTRVREFDVTLAVDGTLDRLDTRFSSEPPLPDLEVFRLLASGGEAILDTGLTASQRTEIEEDPATSAATFLYGQAASVIGQRVNDLFGFDKFRIDPLTGSGDQLSKARVTVGKRLSKDVFVTFSGDPSSTEDQRLQIEWQVGPGLSLILTQNGDDTYSADARWESSF